MAVDGPGSQVPAVDGPGSQTPATVLSCSMHTEIGSIPHTSAPRSTAPITESGDAEPPAKTLRDTVVGPPARHADSTGRASHDCVACRSCRSVIVCSLSKTIRYADGTRSVPAARKCDVCRSCRSAIVCSLYKTIRYADGTRSVPATRKGRQLRSITTLVIVLTIVMNVSIKCAERSGIRLAHEGRCATLIKGVVLNIDYWSLFGGSGRGRVSLFLRMIFT